MKHFQYYISLFLIFNSCTRVAKESNKKIQERKPDKQSIYSLAVSFLDSNLFENIVPSKFENKFLNTDTLFKSELFELINDQKIVFRSNHDKQKGIKFTTLEVNGQLIDSIYDKGLNLISIQELGTINWGEKKPITYYSNSKGEVYFVLSYYDMNSSGIYRFEHKGLLFYLNKDITRVFAINSFGAFRNFYFSYDSNETVKYLDIKSGTTSIYEDGEIIYNINILCINGKKCQIFHQMNMNNMPMKAIISTPNIYNDSTYLLIDKNW